MISSFSNTFPLLPQSDLTFEEHAFHALTSYTSPEEVDVAW
jgi:hypothetical protein